MNTRPRATLLVVAIVLIALLIGVARTRDKTVETPTLAGTPANSVSYVCNEGKTINAQFYPNKFSASGSAKVTLSDGRIHELAQTVSADGARFVNVDESFVFLSKGNGALVLENNSEKSFIGCIGLNPNTTGLYLPEKYSNSSYGFSLRLPSRGTTTEEGYVVNDSYVYTALGPETSIQGVQFKIPQFFSDGTNLSNDSYISVESISRTQSCSANLFLDQEKNTQQVAEGQTIYSVASSTGAGSGNRYEEAVYAIPGTNPCIAVRYYIHYGVLENYPKGTKIEFEKKILLLEFDAIRKSLVLAQRGSGN